METINFLSREVDQSDILKFALERVNLKQEQVTLYREKADTLRTHLERYVAEHPDLGLVKMCLSGSLAKHTALKTLNDIDIAVYVQGADAPRELAPLLRWLEARLRTTYHQMPDASIYIDGPCVVIKFLSLGVDIEVAPIYYDGDPDWKGFLWDRTTSEKILTSIPQHIEFLKKRRLNQRSHFIQVVRLLKWWARQRKQDEEPLQIRSFLIELILAKLSDDGFVFDDYHSALESFFQYIQNSKLKENIVFTDFYKADTVKLDPKHVVKIIDPVNSENNVASNITETERLLFLKRADEALDALSFARTCTTQAEAVICWQDLMGSTFSK